MQQKVLIEQTSKLYKQRLLISQVAVIVGGFIALIGFFSEAWIVFGFGIIVMISAIIGNAITRFRVWWDHG